MQQEKVSAVNGVLIPGGVYCRECRKEFKGGEVCDHIANAHGTTASVPTVATTPVIDKNSIDVV